MEILVKVVFKSPEWKTRMTAFVNGDIATMDLRDAGQLARAHKLYGVLFDRYIEKHLKLWGMTTDTFWQELQKMDSTSAFVSKEILASENVDWFNKLVRAFKKA